MTSPARPDGLQPQRTALAWQRTALAAAVCALLLLHAAKGHIAALPWLPAVLAAATAGQLAVIGVLRARRLRQAPASPMRAGPARLVTVSITVTALVTLSLLH